MQRPSRAEAEGFARRFKGVLHLGDVLLLCGYLHTTGGPVDGLYFSVVGRFSKLIEACDERVQTVGQPGQSAVIHIEGDADLGSGVRKIETDVEIELATPEAVAFSTLVVRGIPKLS